MAGIDRMEDKNPVQSVPILTILLGNVALFTSATVHHREKMLSQDIAPRGRPRVELLGMCAHVNRHACLALPIR